MSYPDKRVLVNPDAWGSDEPVREALIRWGRVHECIITHVLGIPSGGSGSRIAVAGIKPIGKRSYDRILKVTPPDVAQREATPIEQAKRRSPPDFFNRHIAEVKRADVPPDPAQWWVQEQEIAGVSLSEIKTLGKLAGDPGFAEMCATVVRAVAIDWRQQDGDEYDAVPSDFLREFFSTSESPRGEPGLRDFARQAELTLDSPQEVVLVPGRQEYLPNPFQLWDGKNAAEALTRKVRFYVANGHGDLNRGNILVPVVDDCPVASEFRLIDYGRFSHATPVSRDPAKLLLDIAGTWLAHYRPHSPMWARLAELVAWPDRHPDTTEITGYLKVARAIHGAGAEWYLDGTLQTWRPQHLVVLAASALRFVADVKLPMEVRWWYFSVAALATRGLVDPASLTSPITPLDGPERVPAGATLLVPPPAITIGGDTPGVTGVLAEVASGLADRWAELADVVRTPREVRAGFPPGQESVGLMTWMKTSGKIVHLRDSLIQVGRLDHLVGLLDADF